MDVVGNLLDAIEATLNQLTLEDPSLLQEHESLVSHEEHGVTPGVPGNVEHEGTEYDSRQYQYGKQGTHAEKHPRRERYQKSCNRPEDTVEENKRVLSTDDENVLRRPLSLELIGHTP